MMQENVITCTWRAVDGNAKINSACLILIIHVFLKIMHILCFQDYTFLRRKLLIMVFNYCSFGLAVYFFFRHNSYCEPGGIDPFKPTDIEMYYAVKSLIIISVYSKLGLSNIFQFISNWSKCYQTFSIACSILSHKCIRVFVPAPLGARDTMCIKVWPNRVAALHLVLQGFRFHLFAQLICMYLDSKWWIYLSPTQGWTRFYFFQLLVRYLCLSSM